MSADQPNIEAQFRDGTLLDAIGQTMPSVQRMPFLDDCVAGHNAGRIDLIELVETGALDRLDGPEFFRVQRFYCKAIPLLNGVPVERMMNFVTTLVARGGSDLAAGLPNRAFTEWCAADLSRASAVIQAARQGDATAIGHLAFALQAKKDKQTARDIAKSFNDTRQLAAITALSRMPHDDDAERALTISTVSAVLHDGAEDALKANVVSCVGHTFESGKTALSTDALAVLQKALHLPGDLTINAAAEVLTYADACLEPRLVEVLTPVLRYMNPQDRGAIDILDFALDRLLRRGFADSAVELARDLLSRENTPACIDQLDSFATALAQGAPEILNQVAVSWLLKGDRNLCESVNELVSKNRAEDASMMISFDALELTDEQIYFVCRKAIGYLFLNPIAAGSVLVSALRCVDGKFLAAIKELLFDPLLINYGGGLPDYLRSIEKDDAAFAAVQDVLKRVEDYVAGLESIGTVKELHPSEYRRQLERIRMMDFNREVSKKAEQKSIFHDIVHRSVLLHGKHSITLVEGVDGQRKPIEMNLHTFTHSLEWPRMETVDPVGLDLRLRTFRAEQFKR